MKIKSLLLGSAAAMAVATTGASAADAIIVAEPEPVEYVRVCDAFGSGYFSLQGTDTRRKHERGASVAGAPIGDVERELA